MADKRYKLTFAMSDGTNKEVQFTAPQGPQGANGSRGTGVLKVTTAPSSYTTATGGFTPTYRIALSTVKSQSKATEVLVGDTVAYSYYQYPVGYVDTSYVYLGARNSIRGAAGAAGAAGADGYTPVKGTDYFTPADQEAIVQQVLAALGTPVFGTVDENNNIILTGDLTDGTYTLKYENADGQQTIIGTLSMASYINQIPISTDTDGTVYNGTGYMAERRINSSGAVATLSASGATNPLFVTGFIPVKSGDVVRLKNCWIDATNVANSGTYGQNGWSVQNAFYGSDRGQLGLQVWTETTSGTYTTATADSDGHVTEFTIANASVAYMRLCLAPTTTPADAILTVNQEIRE